MRILQVASLLPLVLVLAAVLAPWAQAADGPHLNVVEVNTVNYPTIKVTFEALGPQDQPITGLDRKAFSVSENGQQQMVVSGYAVQDSSRPLAVMLAMDTSLSMRDDGKMQQAQDAAKAFVSQMRPLDRVGLIQFDSQYSVVSPFSSDRTALTQKIDALTPQGNTRLYDALTLAINQTATGVDGSKAVVLMTDGQDTESAADLSQVMTLIHDTNMRVYPIGIGSDIDDKVLTQIANASGGHFYRAPNASDIGTAFRQMAEQVRNRYELVYSSPATAVQGAPVNLRLTAQTPQGLAVAQSTYAMPSYTRPTRPGQAPPSGQPQSVQSGAAAGSTNNSLAAGGLAAFGVLLAASGLAFTQVEKARQARLSFFIGGAATLAPGELEDEGQSPFAGILVPLLRVLAVTVTRLLPPNQVQRTSRQLILAGNPFGWRVSHFVTARVLLAAGATIAAALFLLVPNPSSMGLVLTPVAGFLGYRAPSFWLKRRIKTRQNSILKALPDALDLLTICVEAGLALDGAMLEVVNKWSNPLSDEFAVVLAELKMGRSRRDALRGLADRTGVQEVKVFTSAMVQADELGMGIARPLALQAEQLRLKRRQRAEKLAHEAGTKLIVAMGLFIMPAIFLIILAPAAVQLATLFAG